MHDLDHAVAAVDRGLWSIATTALQNLALAQIEGNQQVLDLTLQILTQGDFEQQWEIAKIVPKLGEIAMLPLVTIVHDSEAD